MKNKENKRVREFPEEGELVLCTVKEIKKPQVFVEIDKYKKLGVMQFSEVAPGRIRNIRDYVVPNKKIVCKVLRVLPDGHIDLSLRRVSAKEREGVMKIYKREKDSESLLRVILKDKFNEIKEKILEKFESYYNFLMEITENPDKAKEVGIKGSLARELIEETKRRFKEKQVSKIYALNLKTYSENGLEVIKKFLSEIGKFGEVRYISAPHYELIIKGKDFQEINKKFNQVEEAIKKAIKDFEEASIKEKD